MVLQSLHSLVRAIVNSFESMIGSVAGLVFVTIWAKLVTLSAPFLPGAI
jgi:hypothetical protein